MIRIRIIFATILVCLGLASCHQKKNDRAPQEDWTVDYPAPPVDPIFSPPRQETIRSMTVRDIENMPDSITLVDGKWEDPASRRSVTLARDFVVVGDVCRDGNPPDAVVLLGANYGGTGDILHLAVVSKQGAGIRNVGNAAVGDRVQVRDARVDGNGRIVLEVVQAGPHDAMCCPGETAERSWAMEDGVLKEVASTSQRGRLSPANLNGSWWMLRYWNLDEEAPPLISIKFQNGIVIGTDGCDQFHAEVRGGHTPGDIAFIHATRTQMACGEPKDSVETRFLAQLNGVTKFSFVATELALTYRVGDKIGTMRFIAPKL